MWRIPPLVRLLFWLYINVVLATLTLCVAIEIGIRFRPWLAKLLDGATEWISQRAM